MSTNRAPITVILINYNGKDILRHCLESFVQQTVLPERLLFVDNGSSAFDEHAVRRELGERYDSLLEFLRLEKNVGYAKGMNEGLKKALSHPHATEWVMTLSNDTELAPDLFEAFAKIASSAG